jgi:uncharacterized SAM-binding protein YcdF (DUF218 family)
MRFLLRRLLDLLLLLVLTAGGVTASAVWFALYPAPQPAETIIVLGGGMTGDNALASETIGRVETGVAVYEAGLAPFIHFTGGSPGTGRPGAGEQMRDLAISLGVPASAATAESASKSTLQNALMSREVLGPRAGQGVILVSDGFHLGRAWASFRWAGYRPVHLAASSAFGRQSAPDQLRRVAREALAWWFNLARVATYEAMALAAGPDPDRIRMLR